MAWTLIVNGGVDTTTYAPGQHLPLSRSSIRRYGPGSSKIPDLMASAREEFLRFYSPVGVHARTVARPIEIAGSKLERGDRVLISWMGANHDPKEFENPDEIVLDRFPNRHAAFGMGIHRCLGSNIARAEFDIVMEQVLRRLPDYRIDRDAALPYPNQAAPGWIKIPATFTPGRIVGAKL